MISLATTLSALALATGGVHVAIAPQNAAPDGMVRISVAGLPAGRVDARIQGGVASKGRWLEWVRLLPGEAGAWHTILRAPGYLGVYPIQLRVRGRLIATGVSVRILPAGFARRPGFWEPQHVAAWWAGTEGARLLGVTTWHFGFFTHRDPTFNRLLRVRVVRRNGIHSTTYLSIARLKAASPWRLLMTAVAP